MRPPDHIVGGKCISVKDAPSHASICAVLLHSDLKLIHCIRYMCNTLFPFMQLLQD